MPNIELIGFKKHSKGLAYEISKHIPPGLRTDTVITVCEATVYDLDFDQWPFIRVTSTNKKHFAIIARSLKKVLEPDCIFNVFQIEFLLLHGFKVVKKAK